jgi:hypothetical protein
MSSTASSRRPARASASTAQKEHAHAAVAVQQPRARSELAADRVDGGRQALRLALHERAARRQQYRGIELAVVVRRACPRADALRPAMLVDEGADAPRLRTP